MRAEEPVRRIAKSESGFVRKVILSSRMASRGPTPLDLSPPQARAFLRIATGLDRKFATTAEAIRHLGYIQMDPIDVCGKMHDLVLRNRVAGYRRDELLATLYTREPREFFEHYIPGRGILVALPVTDYPFLAARMRQRRREEGYGGALNAAQTKIARHILKRIADEGPLGASAFLDEQRSETGWGTSGSLAKTALDKLFFHGRLLVSRREKFRRIYDLPERVLPAGIGKARPAGPKPIARWLAMEKLRQRRLVKLGPAQLALVKKEVLPVRVGGGLLHVLKEDAGLLEETRITSDETLLLAPLDPVIYDREVTRRVWGFDYTWEVYTPPLKRVRGYYALPMLAGDEIVGHVDPKADRTAGVLVARTNVRNRRTVQAPLQELAKFLGLEKSRLEA